MARLVLAVDTQKCRGYGNCVGIMPDVFHLREGDATVTLLVESVDESEVDDVEDAVFACPTRAISFTRL